MKLLGKISLLCLFTLFSFSINAQEKTVSPTSKDDFECGLISTPPIQLNVLVWSNKKGYIKDLTYKEFEVYDEKVLQEIDSFLFNELTNQYSIGFYPKVVKLTDNKWHNIEIKINLSAEKRKKYGKILISGQTGYYPNQN